MEKNISEFVKMVKETIGELIDGDSKFNDFLKTAEKAQLAMMYSAFVVAAENSMTEAKDKLTQALVNQEKAKRLMEKFKGE